MYGYFKYFVCIRVKRKYIGKEFIIYIDNLTNTHICIYNYIYMQNYFHNDRMFWCMFECTGYI